MLPHYRIVVEAGLVEGNEECAAILKKIPDWNGLVVVLFLPQLGTYLHLCDPLGNVMLHSWPPEAPRQLRRGICH